MCNISPLFLGTRRETSPSEFPSKRFADNGRSRYIKSQQLRIAMFHFKVSIRRAASYIFNSWDDNFDLRFDHDETFRGKFYSSRHLIIWFQQQNRFLSFLLDNTTNYYYTLYYKFIFILYIIRWFPKRPIFCALVENEKKVFYRNTVCDTSSQSIDTGRKVINLNESLRSFCILSTYNMH